MDYQNIYFQKGIQFFLKKLNLKNMLLKVCFIVILKNAFDIFNT